MSQFTVPKVGSLSVPINSTTQPVLVSSFASIPVQLINLSPTNAIWVDDNPQVSTGRGVRIAGGTGLPWLGSSTEQIWAILETGSTASATLVISGLVGPYQGDPSAIATALINSGTLIIDKPVRLFANAIAGGGTAGPFAVSTFQTVHINTSPANVTGTNRVVSFTWSDDNGDTVATDTWTWTLTGGSGGGADLLPVVDTIPVRGSQLTVSVTGAGANTQSLILVGSHRPWNPYLRTAIDRVLFSATATIAASSSLTGTPVQRYDGLCQCMMQTFPGATGTLRQEVNDIATGALVFGGGTSPLSGIDYSFGVFTLPRNTWNVNIFNDNTASLSFRIEIIARPEG